MSPITLLGLIAATLTTASFLPQTIQSMKTKNTRSLSLPMYVMFVAGISLWLIYGVFISNLPIIAANVVTLILASIILYLKIQNG